MIFIDFETTGIPGKAKDPIEVLSLTASKVIDGKTIDSVTRYYYHTHAEADIQSVLAINGLTHKRVIQLRDEQSANYALFYPDDLLFWNEYLNDPEHKIIVSSQRAELHPENYAGEVEEKLDINSYNINFDFQFLPHQTQAIASGRCTMRAVMAFLGLAESEKYIRLTDACKLFGIEFDDNKAHASIYDVEKCIEVWNYIKSHSHEVQNG